MADRDPIVATVIRQRDGSERTYYMRRSKALAHPNFVRFNTSPEARSQASRANVRADAQRKLSLPEPSQPIPGPSARGGSQGATRGQDRAARPGAGARVRAETERKEAAFGQYVTTLESARYVTAFRGFGSVEHIQLGVDPVYYPELYDFDHPTENAPAQFFTQESGLLRKVNFAGVKPERELVEEVNDRLQFAGEERQGFDFRLVYATWEYRYSVIEYLGPGVNRTLVDVIRRG